MLSHAARRLGAITVRAARFPTAAKSTHLTDTIMPAVTSAHTADVLLQRRAASSSASSSSSASGSDAPNFALVKIGGDVAGSQGRDAFAQVCRSLVDGGVLPVVVHGGGPQMNDALEAAGIEPEYRGGHRVTTADTLCVAKRIFQEVNLGLADALEAAGVRARPIPMGVFEAEADDVERLGLVGTVTHVREAPVRSALAAGCLPVLTSLGESAHGQILNINADVCARELSLALQPDRTVFVSAAGGWAPPGGPLLARVSLRADYARLAALDYDGRQGSLLKLNEVKALLDGLPASASVLVTAVESLEAGLAGGAEADGTLFVA